MTIRRGAPCGRPSRAILASAFRHDCPEAVPPFPARDSETCYTPRSNLDTPRFDPNPLHAHKFPPTMPGPPTMSTCSKSNLQNPPKTQNAPGAAATSQKCADLPPTGPKMIPAIPPMPAPPTPGSISRNNKNAASPDSLHSAASAPSFSRSPAATVPKVSTSESRHELSSQYPVTRSSKNFSKLCLTVASCAFDTLSIPDFRHFPASFAHTWTLFGQLWARQAAFLLTCVASPTRSWTPPPATTLIVTSGADAITRNELLYSPKRPAASILAIAEVLADAGHHLYNERRPFQREPAFDVTSVNYSFAELLARAEKPAQSFESVDVG